MSYDDTLIGEFVRLAAAYADELTHGGQGDELRRRAAAFDTLIAPGSPLDNARTNAQAVVTKLRARLHISDAAPKPLKSGRRRILIDPDPGDVVYIPERPECLRPGQACRLDRERVRWDMAAAMEDAEALLRYELPPEELPPPDRQVLEQWHQAVWEARISMDQEHLLGAYLLAECQKALDPACSTPRRYKEVVELLLKTPERHVKALKDAAEDLFLTAGQPVGPASSTSVSRPGRFHLPDEPRAEEFTFGPIAGTLKFLARMVCPQLHRSKDPRTLERLDAEGQIWTEKVSGQLYKIYFKDQAIYARAHALELSEKPQQQASKAQKKTK
jgi:hypothetical protein